MGVAIRGVILITVKMALQRQIIELQWRWQNGIQGFGVTYLATLERELRGCKIAVGDYCSSQRLYSIPYFACLIIFFNKKHLVIKMAPHFDTYHWSKNTVHECQNTIQGCKMTFGTHFLATPIGVALMEDLTKRFATFLSSYVILFSLTSVVIVYLRKKRRKAINISE